MSRHLRSREHWLKVTFLFLSNGYHDFYFIPAKCVDNDCPVNSVCVDNKCNCKEGFVNIQGACEGEKQWLHSIFVRWVFQPYVRFNDNFFNVFPVRCVDSHCQQNAVCRHNKCTCKIGYIDRFGSCEGKIYLHCRYRHLRKNDKICIHSSMITI